MKNAELYWSNKHPHSREFDDIYFSADDPLGESQYVFIKGNDLETRFTEIKQGESFTIAELGFGSGLNFLSVISHFDNLAPAGSRLYYLAFEKAPLDKDSMNKIHAMWKDLQTYSDLLLQEYPDYGKGLHRLKFSIHNKYIFLDLVFGDANQTIADIEHAYTSKVNAWFLDGFAPAKNPELWNEYIIKYISLFCADQATLSTYSVAGHLRRSLQANNFETVKAKGFGKKRHMLKARIKPTTRAAKPQQWFYYADNNTNNEAIVIGAGLSGSATANSLAQRGWKVTVLDKAASIASGASGNSRGIVYPAIGNTDSPLYKLHLCAFLYAVRNFQRISKTKKIGWHQCGLLDFKQDFDELLADTLNNQYCKVLQSADMSNFCGINLNKNGLFFPLSGWLVPSELCKAYLDHPNIQFVGQQQVLNLKKNNALWSVMVQEDNGIQLCHQAHNVILCNSMDAQHLLNSNYYPTIANKGQVDIYNETPFSANLKYILCDKGYFLPSHDKTHATGGVFRARQNNSDIIEEDTMQNQAILNDSFPELKSVYQCSPVHSWAGVRCTSPDYFPITGPVENLQECKNRFSAWSKNARATINKRGEYEAGLYINIAHGSHGLSRIPLMSEHLASLMNNEPLPLSDELISLTHPMRFLIRALKRQEQYPPSNGQ